MNFQCESYESKMRTVQASLGQQPAPFSECSLDWHACLHVMTCVCYMSHVSPQVSKFYKYQTAKHRNPSWLMLAREFHTFPNYVPHCSPSFTIFHPRCSLIFPGFVKVKDSPPGAPQETETETKAPCGRAWIEMLRNSISCHQFISEISTLIHR